ncbi:hypothetical protein Tco_1322857, partial [Tanacetum coccineum]
HVNSISLIRIEEGKVVDNNVVEPNKSDLSKPIEEIGRKEETKGGANDETVRNAKKEPKEELVEMHRSQSLGYYLKHEINKKLIEGLIGNQCCNDSLLAVQLGKMDNETYDSLPIPELLYNIEEETKDGIGPVTPNSTVSRLILEWEERIKLHKEKEMEFNQWRSKVFNDGRSILRNGGCGLEDERGVM